ncbi:MAG: hypothetical protein IT193_09310 [Propionibacteriaceae bacterium]|nr:hypothetical protein [Propionibacteriaceae bacterium]
MLDAPVVAEVRVSSSNQPADQVPNAALWFHDGRVGMDVTPALLGLSQVEIEFALAHELGHAVSAREIQRSDLRAESVSTASEEVLADLGAAQILRESGRSWAEITSALDGGNLTDADWSGNHPPGEVRKGFLRLFESRLAEGRTAAESVHEVCTIAESALAKRSSAADLLHVLNSIPRSGPEPGGPPTIDDLAGLEDAVHEAAEALVRTREPLRESRGNGAPDPRSPRRDRVDGRSDVDDVGTERDREELRTRAREVRERERRERDRRDRERQRPTEGW